MQADSSAKNLICNFLSKKEGGSLEFGDIHFQEEEKNLNGSFTELNWAYGGWFHERIYDF